MVMFMVVFVDIIISHEALSWYAQHDFQASSSSFFTPSSLCPLFFTFISIPCRPQKHVLQILSYTYYYVDVPPPFQSSSLQHHRTDHNIQADEEKEEEEGKRVHTK